MDFAFSYEQELLRKSAREFLADRHPLDRVPALVDTDPGWDPACWGEIAQLGWLDDDLGLLEQAVLLEETAYDLLPAPVFSTLALALPAIEHDEQARRRVAAGTLRLTLAWAEDGQPQGLAEPGVVGTTVGAGGVVSGRKVLVPDAAFVDALVVVGRGDDGTELRLVEAGYAQIVPRSTSDRSRRLAEVGFDAAPSTALVGAAETPAVLGRIELRAMVLAAAEALGIGRRALDLAVDHASAREQFGKLIGTYQGVSHRLADSYAALELARSLTYWATWALTAGAEQAAAACAAAKSAAAEAAVLSCEHAIQVSGGLGMTWEHVLHRLYKRALWLEAFGGSGRELRARIADRLLCPQDHRGGGG